MTDEVARPIDVEARRRRFAATEGRGARLRVLLFRSGPLIALLLLVLVLSLTAPYFLTLDNLLTVARQSSFVAILAIGQTVVIITGGIDLAVAALAALSACVAAVLMTEPISAFGLIIGPLHPVLAVIIALAVGTLAGASSGWFIATLGTMTLLRGVALLVTNGLPVPSFRSGGAGLPQFLIYMGSGSVVGIPVSVVIAAVVALIGWGILRYTAFGRAVYAVGGNREAARISGIDVGRTKILAYGFSGLTAAIGGILLMGRLSSANALMGEGEELRSIASVVIGGTNLFGGEGGVIGSIIGALIIGVLGNGLNLLNVSPFWQRVAQGAVIILVVILDQWRRKRLSRLS
jgi:ribose transport system permease protein